HRRRRPRHRLLQLADQLGHHDAVQEVPDASLPRRPLSGLELRRRAGAGNAWRRRKPPCPCRTIALIEAKTGELSPEKVRRCRPASLHSLPSRTSSSPESLHSGCRESRAGGEVYRVGPSLLHSPFTEFLREPEVQRYARWSCRKQSSRDQSGLLSLHFSS